MILFGRDLRSSVLMVAEIGVNHEGDVDTALRLIRLAAESGAHAVKFQSYTPARFVAATDPDRLARVSRFGLSLDAHRQLARCADEVGVGFFSTAVTEDWIPILAELCPVIKIASGDVTFEPVVRGAAASGRIVIMSTGLATLDEIDRSVGWIEEAGSGELAERLVLLQCVSAYPTPVNEAAVQGMQVLRERYGVPVGYSNHVVGSAACYAAVAMGASVIEVHFTDRRAGRTFRDHALSFEPAEYAELVTAVESIRASLGNVEKVRQPAELENLRSIRKGAVAARDLKANATIGYQDIMFARPATEFASEEAEILVGSRLLVPLQQGHPFRRQDVDLRSH